MIYCRGGVCVAITPAIATAAILFFCGLGLVFVKLIQGVSEKSRVFCDFLEAFNLLDKQVLSRCCGGLRVSCLPQSCHVASVPEGLPAAV